VRRPPRVRGGDGEGRREYDTAAYAASLGNRRRIYGPNIIPTQKNKSLLRLRWLPTDRFLLILCLAAVVSVALDLYRDFSAPQGNTIYQDGCNECLGSRVEWVEGVTILIVVFIVVIVRRKVLPEMVFELSIPLSTWHETT